MVTAFRYSRTLFTIRIILRAIIGLPMKLIGLPAFLKERDRQFSEFSIGDTVLYKGLSDKAHRTIVTVAPAIQELFHEHSLGETRLDGSRILKPPTWAPGSAGYSFFEAFDPWKIVGIRKFAPPLRHYFIGHVFTHPCVLTIRNDQVPLGEKIIEFVPGDMVVKV